jgi:hypothetical protein
LTLYPHHSFLQVHIFSSRVALEPIQRVTRYRKLPFFGSRSRRVKLLTYLVTRPNSWRYTCSTFHATYFRLAWRRAPLAQCALLGFDIYFCGTALNCQTVL